MCIGGLQLGARSHSLHWTVCIPKCAQVRSHETNLKADQSGRGDGGAIVLCPMQLPTSRLRGLVLIVNVFNRQESVLFL